MSTNPDEQIFFHHLPNPIVRILGGEGGSLEPIVRILGGKGGSLEPGGRSFDCHISDNILPSTLVKAS